MIRHLVGTALALVVLALVFGVLERVWPERKEQRLRWRERRTDVTYWFFTAVVTRALTRTVLVVGVVATAIALPRPGAAWIARQPAWAQVIAVLLLADLIGYWTHRLFHRSRILWPIHAVHHSSRTLDWLAAARVHPLNDVVGRAGAVLPLFWLGFAPGVVAAYVPLLTLYSILLHANVSWRYGWLGHVLASPAFHRWHHAAEDFGPSAADGRNFAGLFAFWDQLFGTFHLPAHPPHAYGLVRGEVPTSFWAQLALRS